MDGHDDTLQTILRKGAQVAIFPRVVLSIDQRDEDDDVGEGKPRRRAIVPVAPPNHSFSLPSFIPSEDDLPQSKASATTRTKTSIPSRVYRIPDRPGATPRERLPRLVTGNEPVVVEDEDGELIAPRRAPKPGLMNVIETIVLQETGVLSEQLHVEVKPMPVVEVDPHSVSRWASIAADVVASRPPPVALQPGEQRREIPKRRRLPDAPPPPPPPAAMPWGDAKPTAVPPPPIRARAQPAVAIASPKVIAPLVKPAVDVTPAVVVVAPEPARARPEPLRTSPPAVKKSRAMKPGKVTPSALAPRRVSSVPFVLADDDQTPINERSGNTAPIRVGVFTDGVITIEVDGFRRALTGEAAAYVQAAILAGLKGLKQPKARSIKRLRLPQVE